MHRAYSELASEACRFGVAAGSVIAAALQAASHGRVSKSGGALQSP